MSPVTVRTACVGRGGPLPEQRRRRNPRKWCSGACRVRYVRAHGNMPEHRCSECGARTMEEGYCGYCSNKGVPPAMRQAVLDRDGAVCGICGDGIDLNLEAPDPRALVVDHIVPFAAGGRNVLDNIHPAHSACNAHKAACRLVGSEQLGNFAEELDAAAGRKLVVVHGGRIVGTFVPLERD